MGAGTGADGWVVAHMLEGGGTIDFLSISDGILGLLRLGVFILGVCWVSVGGIL